MANLNTSITVLFLVTVYVRNTARNTVSLSHQTVIAGLAAMMQYVGSRPEQEKCDVREVTLAELFSDYRELVRNARTAQLIQGGVVSDRNGTYTIPDGVEAATLSYTDLSFACDAMIAACKVRGRRAELESIHDRARRLSSLFTDLAAQ